MYLSHSSCPFILLLFIEAIVCIYISSRFIDLIISYHVGKRIKRVSATHSFSLSTPDHWCTSNVYQLRDETERLRCEFNNRLKSILYSTFLNTYSITIIPILFSTRKYIRFDFLMLSQFVFIIYLSLFVLKSSHYLPVQFLTTLHRNAKHLGQWNRLTTSTGTTIPQVWDDQQSNYEQYSIVKHRRVLYQCKKGTNANDQPDCFETPDYPLPDQYHEVGHDNTDAVSQFDISTKEIHDTFNGKYLNGNAVDFSDNSVKARGYVQHGVYQNYSEHESETPIERYKRIMSELSVLEAELGQTSKDGKGLTKEENENLKAVVNHVQQLQEQTSKVYGAKYLISGNNASSGDGGTDTSSLISKIVARQSTSTNANKQGKVSTPTTNDDNKSGSEAFKLYITPTSSISNTTLRFSEIEQKVSKLESLIGINEQPLACLEHLSNRFNVLEQQNLDHIEMKLSNVLTRLNAINEKKALVDDQDRQSKATELFDMMSRWENMAASLPAIEERLVVLNSLHQRALSHYDAEQQALKASLDSNEQLLNKLKTTFHTNLESLKTQLEFIDSK
ncbi:unnamed protein product, partial [Didymodactylos carnosus]